MAIKNFAPCSDWFFVFKDHSGKVINYQLAGWAVKEGVNGEEDSVVGMVPVHGGGSENTVMPGTCRLATVPPVLGSYKHKSELDGE